MSYDRTLLFGCVVRITMAVVVLGIETLDPEMGDPDEHPNLSLSKYSSIVTMDSSAGEPSTYKLWPTIISGMGPEKHGLTLDGSISWNDPVFNFGRKVADHVVPDGLRTQVGEWILNNTEADTFLAPDTYYSENGITTGFDGHNSKAIGVLLRHKHQ